MGRYIEWDDVVDRYPALSSLGGSDELTPTFIDYSESFIDGLLASNFTVPFSNNNMTVRDLSIDICYFRAGRFKLEDAAAVYSTTMMTINMLNSGKLQMINTSGELIAINQSGRVYSTTQSYHSAFGMLPIIDQHIDEDNVDDEQSR